MKDEYKEIIERYIDNYPDLNNTEIIDLLVEDNIIPKSHRTLRRYIGELRNIIKTKSIVSVPIVNVPIVPAVIEEKAEVDEDGNYTIETIKDIFIISETMVNKIFCAYSRGGLNYNKPQILSVMGVDKKIFEALVLKKGLNKESEPLGPNYINNHTIEEQNDELAEILEDLISLFSDADTGISETIIKEYKKKVASFKSELDKKDEIYNSLIEFLPKVKITRYQGATGYNFPISTLYVVVGDMHIGLETDNFNVEAARNSLVEMAATINLQIQSTAYKDVVLLFLGDIMHTVSGVNHANMWKDIEPGLWGAAAIIKPFELIAEFVHNIDNVKAIYGVGGELIAS